MKTELAICPKCLTNYKIEADEVSLLCSSCDLIFVRSRSAWFHIWDLEDRRIAQHKTLEPGLKTQALVEAFLQLWDLIRFRGPPDTLRTWLLSTIEWRNLETSAFQFLSMRLPAWFLVLELRADKVTQVEIRTLYGELEAQLGRVPAFKELGPEIAKIGFGFPDRAEPEGFATFVLSKAQRLAGPLVQPRITLLPLAFNEAFEYSPKTGRWLPEKKQCAK